VKANECKIEYWIRFWYEIEDVSCPERKKQINALSEHDTDELKSTFQPRLKHTISRSFTSTNLGRVNFT
jgi:hypothetical protein